MPLPHALGDPWDTILTIGLVISAIGVIWRKAVRPTVRTMAVVADLAPAIVAVAKMEPGLTALVELEPALRTVATTAPTILEIAAQFKTNGGSSLRDTLDHLESAAASNGRAASRAHRAALRAETSAAKATTAAELAKAAADRDRKKLDELLARTERRVEDIPVEVDRRSPPTHS